MGLSTAFLTGFVGAANRSMYETRMAAHEESVEARADFKWKQRDDEERARELADRKSEREYRAGLITTEAEVAIEEEQRLKILQDEEDRRKLSERLIALNPEFANNPEALAKALLAGDDGISIFTQGGRYDLDGRLMLPDEVLNNNVNKYVRNNAPQYYVGREDEWMNTAAANQFKDLVRARDGISGMDSLLREGGTFEPVYTDGVLTGANLVYASEGGYKPDQFEIISIATESAGKLYAINAVTKGLVLDAGGNIVQGQVRNAYNRLQQIATERLSQLRLANKTVSIPALIDAVFNPYMEFLPELTDKSMRPVDQIINDPNRLDIVRDMTNGEELFLIHQNLMARIELSNHGIVNTGDVDRMQEIGDAIEANPVFKAYIVELEGETVGAGTPPPPVPAGAEAGHDFFIRETFARDIISYNSQISALQETRSEALALQTKLQSQYTDLVARLDTGEIIPGYTPGMEQSYLKSSGEKTEEVRGIDAQIQALQTQINAATTAFEAAQQTVVE